MLQYLLACGWLYKYIWRLLWVWLPLAKAYVIQTIIKKNFVLVLVFMCVCFFRTLTLHLLNYFCSHGALPHFTIVHMVHYHISPLFTCTALLFFTSVHVHCITFPLSVHMRVAIALLAAVFRVLAPQAGVFSHFDLVRTAWLFFTSVCMHCITFCHKCSHVHYFFHKRSLALHAFFLYVLTCKWLSSLCSCIVRFPPHVDLLRTALIFSQVLLFFFTSAHMHCITFIHKCSHSKLLASLCSYIVQFELKVIYAPE